MTAALAVMVLLLVVARPHALPAVRMVALQSLCCLFFTNVVGMSFLPSDGGAEPGVVYREVMGALVLLMHAMFVVSVVRRMLLAVDWQRVRHALAALCRRCKLDLVCCGAFTEPALSNAKPVLSTDKEAEPPSSHTSPSDQSSRSNEAVLPGL